MSHAEQPLIIGAGPVGLGAALFLARQGVAARIVEMRAEPSRESKALAVNPRTLDILEPTGITRKMLEVGLPIRGLEVHRGGRVFAVTNFDGLHPRYPFMLALSQAATERLLAEALTAAGGRVERGLRMVSCKNLGSGVEAVLERSAGGSSETVACPWLLAADGAHSVARHQLEIAFEGSSFAGEWYLADVPLRTRLAADRTHVFLFDDARFLFLIRVVDPALAGRSEEPVWRVLGNRPEPLTQLVEAEQAGPPLWTSSFRIAHRLAATLAAGRVYLAGDAAHVHSPMGARGMNLGLEDAWVFAQLVQAGRLSDYDRLRRPVDRQVVRRVKVMSRVVSGELRLARRLLPHVVPLVLRIPFLRSRMLATVAGLDHALPAFSRPPQAQSTLLT